MVKLFLAASALLSASIVWTGGVLAQSRAARPAVVRVVLPDVSDMHKSVQQQLRDAYAALTKFQSAEAYGELGKLLMAAKYLDVAERCFVNARMLAPDDFRWPYYLGHVFSGKGNLTKAAESFEHVLQLRPGDVATLVWLGYVHVELGQPKVAEEFLTKARTLAPDTAAVLYQLGRTSLAMHDYANAVQRLEEALRLNPTATVIHLPLAMAYRGLGDLEKAQSHLDRAEGRAGGGVSMPDPLMTELSTVLQSPEVYGELGQQATARGDWPDAARHFRKAVELSPEDALARVNLALTLNRLGDARAARAELESAIRIKPRLARGHFMLGALLERSGRDQDAIDRYTAAVTHDPGWRAAQLALADALRRTGRFEASLLAYHRVLELGPHSEEARFGEAMALVRLSRHAEARERLLAAIAVHPDQPAFTQALARLFAASPDPVVRDGRRALDLMQALAVKHKTTSVAETMAMALAEVGRFGEAAEWQRLAMSVALEAGHPDAAQRMAANLVRYEQKEPCRTPWRDDDPEFRPGPKVEPGLLDPPRAAASRRQGAVTFSRDIAPILFERCGVCHRSGGVAPMSLMSYREIRPWARAIADQVRTRNMPPWKPEPDYGGPFIGDRRLTDEQIALVQQWAADGAVEGNPSELPPMPTWPTGWRLGEPDLVVEMASYTLPAGRQDVLRKFAIPIPIASSRHVRGVEFQPGNARVVHHANIRIDPTGASLQLDAADSQPGYDGVTPFAARFPPGYFLGWTPGQLRPLSPESMAWRLDKGSTLLLELHLMPGDGPEIVQSRIGLFFTDVVPTRVPATIRLGRQNIDIPANAKDYVIRDSYVLPVDGEVHGVQPHAHNLAREVKGFATLPDGTRKWLVYIKNWDFDWQDFYVYAKPFLLPKGTELSMEITYDNSPGNRRNPHSPPKRVTWGQKSSDEMGDLWIQVVPRNAADLRTLNDDRWPREIAEDLVGFEMVLAAEPAQVMQHDEAALLYLQVGKVEEAVKHFRESARLQPGSAAAQYNLGTTLLRLRDFEAAIRHFEEALRLDPKYVRAHNDLGATLRLQGKPTEAVDHFRQALQIRPDEGDVIYNLASTLTMLGEVAEAITFYRRGLQVQPDAPELHAALAWLLATHSDPSIRQPSEAVRLAERASGLTNRQDATVLDVLAAAYAAASRFDDATATAREALARVPSASEYAAAIRQRLNLYINGRSYRLPR